MADVAKITLKADDAVEITYVNGAADQDIVLDVADEKSIILVENTDATTARVRIKAGDGIQSVLGDDYVDVAQNKMFMWGPLTSARFKDMDTGKVNIDITGTNDDVFGGTITNVKIRHIVLP